MKVYKTNEYDKFTLVKGNRGVNPSHVKKLKESMLQINLLETLPILVNEDLEIIDGQHRFEAARELGLPIFYTVRDGATLSDVILLNANNKPWHTIDYLNSHIERGKRQYEVVKNFMDYYGIPISVTLTLLNTHYNKRGDLLRSFKDGTYQVSDLSSAKEFADELVKYKPYLEKGTFRSREFIYGVKKLHDEGLIDHPKMLRKLAMQGTRISTASDLKAMLRQLEEVYNFHSREQIRFF